MDLCGLLPSLNLYNRRWPIRTASYPDPSAKFTFDEDGHPGQAVGSIISGGCILSGSMVRAPYSVEGSTPKVKALLKTQSFSTIASSDGSARFAVPFSTRTSQSGTASVLVTIWNMIAFVTTSPTLELSSCPRGRQMDNGPCAAGGPRTRG